jgi:aryl sulfotransferase
MTEIAWPTKTRELHTNHFDSTIWNEFAFRDDDIIVATYGKCGTTWVQQILGQLLFDAAEGLPIADISPWMDLRVPPKAVKLAAVEAQTHRRFLKTHLPVDALVFSPRARYLYVVRDGRDVVWSLYNHHVTANETWYAALNDTPGLVGPKMERPAATVVEYFREWLERDGYPIWSFWDSVRSWWQIRHLPNVQLMHYGELKRDLPAAIRRIADHFNISIRDELWPDILAHSDIDYMRDHGDKTVPLGGAFWEGGARSFIFKGVNGRWRDQLPADLNAAYEARARAELGDECAAWLAGPQ